MKFKLTVFLVISFLFIFASSVYAQQFPSLGGIAVNVEIADSSASAGDILVISKEGLKRANVPYDINIYGVVDEAPVLSVAPKTDNTKAVLTSGVTDVKVSAESGKIEIGDYITSSGKAGIGRKATESGYVLGKALGSYEDTASDGKISVEVNIGYAEVGASGSGITKAIARAIGNPETFQNLLRYILAAIVIILTIIGGSFAFIKFMNTGLLSIGRNPLAKKTIISAMFMSGLVVVVISIVGFSVAALIIGLNNILR